MTTPSVAAWPAADPTAAAELEANQREIRAAMVALGLLVAGLTTRRLSA